MKTETVLNQYLPAYDFNEVHQISIRATPERAFAAIKELRPAELSPLIYWMFSLRELPARLTRKPSLQPVGGETFLEQLFADEFLLLEEAPNREIVFGLIGQFWELTGGKSPQIASPQEFLAFDQTDYAKVAANLAVTDLGNGLVCCSTETRIHAPDPATRKKFAFYWRLISLGSGFIRILWLKAIQRRAERSGI